MKDMWKKLLTKYDGHPDDNCTETSAFWIGLRQRHMEQHNLHGDVRENIRLS